MKRFVFNIQYNGTKYHGWQKQIGQISVQEKIEQALKKLFHPQAPEIIGCGRTDTGVHAFDYFFHVDLEEKYEMNELLYKLNRVLPKDIALKKVFQAKNDFHARFDATARLYRYFIHYTKNPFNENLSYFLHDQLNIEKMNEASKYLLGKQDFTSFSKLHTDVKNNICEVYSASWNSENETSIYFEIKANRFLRNMVRAIVGTLIEVGQNKIEANELKNILEAKDRSSAKKSAPAHGLFLWKIEYPEEIFN